MEIRRGRLIPRRCTFPILQAECGIKPCATLGGLVGVADRLEIKDDVLINRSP